ncbi:multidrug effflux MFS transporter [Escherichia coli]|nr:multidrug effflux MFS transporter [Klebsiella quasipneumoniae]EIV8404046.1 multidrug effflux MFS transporter [Escherichia coli]MCD7095349.1 multidrug effflux MFS transporter [Klebsiella quasipneumoniae subsp. similipneumoniae]
MMTKKMLKYAIILGALTALGPLCTDFYLSALPDMTADLSSSNARAQLTLTTALIGLGFGQFIFGPLSDRIGRKKPLLASLLLFIMSSLWCAFTQDMNQLILARLIQGVAGAGGAVLSRAIARDLYNGKALTNFFALLMTVNGIAPVLAPVLGSIQLSVTGWRGLFITLACAGVLMFLASIFGLNETRVKSVSKKKTTTSLQVLKDRTFISFSLLQGFMMAGLFAYIGASSYVLQDIYHLTPQHYSMAFALNGIGMIISSILMAKLAHRFSEMRILKITLYVAIFFSAMLLAMFWLNFSLLLSLSMLFMAVSVCSGICTLSSSLAMQSQGDNSGTASAWMGMMMFAMGGISAPLTGINGTSGISMATVIFFSYLFAFLIFLYGKNNLGVEK